MTLSLTLGWWLLPLAATIIAALWGFIPRASERRSGDYDFTFWLPAAFRACAATILSLLVWLLWAVFV